MLFETINNVIVEYPEDAKKDMVELLRIENLNNKLLYLKLSTKLYKHKYRYNFKKRIKAL